MRSVNMLMAIALLVALSSIVPANAVTLSANHSYTVVMQDTPNIEDSIQAGLYKFSVARGTIGKFVILRSRVAPGELPSVANHPVVIGGVKNLPYAICRLYPGDTICVLGYSDIALTKVDSIFSHVAQHTILLPGIHHIYSSALPSAALSPGVYSFALAPGSHSKCSIWITTFTDSPQQAHITEHYYVTNLSSVTIKLSPGNVLYNDQPLICESVNGAAVTTSPVKIPTAPITSESEYTLVPPGDHDLAPGIYQFAPAGRFSFVCVQGKISDKPFKRFYALSDIFVNKATTANATVTIPLNASDCVVNIFNVGTGDGVFIKLVKLFSKPKPKPKPQAHHLLCFPPGVYLVGRDFPSGRFLIATTSDFIGVIVVPSGNDFSRFVLEFIGLDPQYANSRSCWVILKPGDTLKVSGGSFMIYK